MTGRFATRISLAVIALVAACDEPARPAPTPASAAPTAGAADSAGISVGAEVVAASGKLSFRGGKVVRIADREVTFEYGRPDRTSGKRPTQTVTIDKVWPRQGANPPKAGDVAVCGVAELVWLPCEIQTAEGANIGIEDSYGRHHQLDRRAIVTVDDATRKTLTDYLAREKKHRAFDAAFLDAGRPTRPSGWQPSAGAKVVIHFVGTSWYGGRVEELVPDKNKARIAWDGDTWQGRDVALDQIVPQPTNAAAVATDQFVLVRPSDPAGRWEHKRVVSSRGDQLEVVDRDGSKAQVAAKDVIVVSKP